MFKRRTSSSRITRKYAHNTNMQLASAIKKLQKQYAKIAKSTTGKTVRGKTPAQQCRAIQQEVQTIAKLLRTKTVAQINAKLKTLKAQMAKSYGVKLSSPKATSPAIKRLIAKRRAVMACPTIPKLVSQCKGFKPSSYKNPKTATRSTSAYTRTKSRRSTTRRTTKARRTTRTTGASRTRVYSVISKYNKQTNKLKKEIRKLKSRNSFMKKQVAKFRKEVAQLQRHYGTLNNKPRWRVVQNKKVGKEVSNIVRFSNALTNAFLKQPQRKAG